MNRIFISPAQHQIHHSEHPDHWDRNFGGAFALWDWAFGTLHVPKEKERLEFGIGPETHEYDNPVSLYIRPIQKNLSASRPSALATIMLFVLFSVAAIWTWINFDMTMIG